MRCFPRAVVLLAFLIAVTAGADPLPAPPAPKPSPADAVRVQPRGSGLDPNSVEEEALQERIKTFNEKQDRQDAEIDRKLRICRGC
jgi:hypothetical protein